MSLVVFEKTSLSLGGKSIIDDLSLRIGNGERVGLVGPNGSGKSTLLRLIAGEQQPDGGVVRVMRGARVGYLAQDVRDETGIGLLAFVLASVPGRIDLEDEIAHAEQELQGATEASEDEHEALLDLAGHLADLHERLAHHEALYSEHEAQTILAGLGFKVTDYERDMGEFSGGWRMRAVLASLLFQRPDLLLLDEPTNHLDMPSVAWLSGFLARYARAFILISHDREFLNEQIKRVVSFEVEGVRTYPGDYDHYLKQRAEERVLLENRAKNVERERAHLEQFIDRFRYKASKAAQVQSRVKLLEKMEQVEVLGERAQLRFRFPTTERTGRQVLETEGLCKSYGDHEVLHDVNLLLERGDRVALIGENGAGKTTLLRALAGEIELTSGSFTFGHKTKIGYYAQHHAEALDPTQTVYESVYARCPEGGQQRVRSVLGALLFSDGDIDKKVGVLSGGERARVALAQLLVDPGNVLLMDEPTNHLDLDSSERLAEALSTFDGTLLFVSHNRGFIRRLGTKIWSVADGGVETYPGSLDDYLHALGKRDSKGDPEPNRQTLPPAKRAETEKPPPPKRGTRAEEKARKRAAAEARQNRTGGGVGPLRSRISKLEARIAELEAKQREQTDALSDPAVYEDAQTRDKLSRDLAWTTRELEQSTGEWMEAQEQLEAL